MRHSAKQSGFTLLELSIVLIIIALVTGMSIASGVALISSGRVMATEKKISEIEKALMQYRVANNRLPCPGDITLTSSSANFALEAGSGSTCTTGTGACRNNTVAGTCVGTAITPAANFGATGATNTNATSAEGALPVLTMGLPLDFMVDGWGNRLRYAVDEKMTAYNAFTTVSIGCNTGAITVKDANGTARSTGSIYALVSHGPNGHGSYTPKGVILNAGSANAKEQTNCHCNSTGTTTTTSGTQTTDAATYYQASPSSNPSNGLDSFDDIVAYKERWQLQTSWDRSGNMGCGADVIALALVTYPAYIYFYTISGTTVTGTSSDWQSDQLIKLTYSPDSNLMYVNQRYEPTAIYTVSSNGKTVGIPVTYLTTFGSSYTSGNPLAVSSDGIFIARSTSTNTGSINLYQKSGSSYNTLTSVASLSTAIPASVSFDPYANHLAVGVSGDGVNPPPSSPQIYKRTGTSFSILGSQPDVAFTDATTGMLTTVRYSPDGSFLYATDPADTSGKYFRIYTVSGDTHTYLTSQPGVQPTSPRYIAVDPTNTYVALSNQSTAPRISIYKRSAATFTRLSSPSSLPGSTVNDLIFTKDGKYLAMALASSPYIMIYSIDSSTDTFTALASPVLLPPSAAGSLTAY